MSSFRKLTLAVAISSTVALAGCVDDDDDNDDGGCGQHRRDHFRYCNGPG